MEFFDMSVAPGRFGICFTEFPPNSFGSVLLPRHDFLPLTLLPETDVTNWMQLRLAGQRRGIRVPRRIARLAVTPALEIRVWK